jgi:hypothetical protein
MATAPENHRMCHQANMTTPGVVAGVFAAI